MFRNRPFSGADYEDPIDHLIKFERLCFFLGPPWITQKTLRIKLFTLSLTKRAEQWEDLWVDFYCPFFLARYMASLQSDILNFKQLEEDSIGAAWARFLHLLKSSPTVSLPDWVSLCIFHSGLDMEFALYLDTTARGEFTYLTMEEGR
jgi:hypothetical protein